MGRLARRAALLAGSTWFFMISLALTLIWLFSGFFIGFNDAWNFWANTSTTVITFLLVILVQNSQNRDTVAIQTKLDELILATERASNRAVGMEELPEAEQQMIKREIDNL